MSQAFKGLTGVKTSCQFQTIQVHILDFVMQFSTTLTSSVVQGKTLSMKLGIDSKYILPLEAAQVEVLDSDDLPSSQLQATLDNDKLNLTFIDVPKDIARIRINVPVARADGNHIETDEMDSVSLSVDTDLN